MHRTVYVYINRLGLLEIMLSAKLPFCLLFKYSSIVPGRDVCCVFACKLWSYKLQIYVQVSSKCKYVESDSKTLIINGDISTFQGPSRQPTGPTQS